MVTHSSVLFRDGGAWWAAVYGVTQSRTRLKRLSSSSRLIITFLPRNKRLLISWLQSPSAVILEPKKIKSFTVSIVSPSICCEVMGPDAMILVFRMLSFKSTFHSPFSLSSRGFLVLLHFLPGGSVICISEVIGIAPGNCDSSLYFLQPGIPHDVYTIG